MREGGDQVTNSDQQVSIPHKRHPRGDQCAMCNQMFNDRMKPSSLCHSIYRVRISKNGKQAFVSGDFCSICLAKLYEQQAPRIERNHQVEYISPAIRPNGMEIPAFPKFRKLVEERFMEFFEEIFEEVRSE